MRVAIRVDASTLIGIGHVARCLALAKELATRGAEVVFVSRQLDGHMFQSIADHGYRLFKLRRSDSANSEQYAWLGVPPDNDVEETMRFLRDYKPDLLIVDHYGIGRLWESLVRPFVHRILVIDDLANREHECDYLLDQNFSLADENPYARLAPDALMFLGTRYALLRDEFRHARAKLRRKEGASGTVAICFGGSDHLDFTSATIRAIEPLLSQLKRVDVIVGPSNRNLPAISARLLSNAKFNIVVGASDLSALISEADLVVGAGGSMCWERFCLGAPTLAFGLAENQERLLDPLIRAGFVVGVAFMPYPDESLIRAWLTCLLTAPQVLAGLSQRASDLVDGFGVVRIVDALMGDVASPRDLKNSAVDVLCTDHLHPIVPVLLEWCERQFSARLCFSIDELRGGAFLFLISCHSIVGDEIRSRYRHSLVIHASKLPEGRGWSPLVWQLLEGRREIAVSLIVATEPVDSGDVWVQDLLQFDGTEDFDEINEKLFESEIRLMDWALANCEQSEPQLQQGEASYYRRRIPADSALDPEMTLSTAFDRIRVCDPVRYPAHLNFRNYTYSISLKKVKKTKR